MHKTKICLRRHSCHSTLLCLLSQASRASSDLCEFGYAFMSPLPLGEGESTASLIHHLHCDGVLGHGGLDAMRRTECRQLLGCTHFAIVGARHALHACCTCWPIRVKRGCPMHNAHVIRRGRGTC